MTQAHIATLLFTGPFLLLCFVYGIGIWMMQPRAVRVKKDKRNDIR